MEFIQNVKREELERAEILLEQAKPNVKLDIFDESTVASLKEAMDLFEKWEAEAKMAEVYEYWGNYQNKIKTYESALNYTQKSLNIKLKLYGEHHLKIAESYYSMADYHGSLGNLSISKNYLEKSLKINTEILGEANTLAVKIYNLFGSLCFYEEDYKSAVSYRQKGLYILKKLESPAASLLEVLYCNLAAAYLMMGKYDDGETYLKLGLKLALKSVSPNDSNLTSTYNNFGFLYMRIGDFRKSYQYYQKAISISRGTEGSAYSYHTLGVMMAWQNNYIKSNQYYEAALKILKQQSIKKHSLFQMLYLNWGISFLQQRNTEKALFYLQKSLEEAVKTYGHQHLTIGRIYDSIGSCYTFMNDFEKAENYFEKAFDIFQNNENSQIRDFASVWTYLGYLFHQKQQYLKAIQFHQKALKHILSNQVSEDIYSHPFLETQVYPRQISVRYHFLIRILCNKAHSFRAYYLYKTQKNRDLEAANDAYKAVVYFGDGIRQAFLADVSKLIVAKEVQKALVKAVGVAVMRFEWAQKTEHFQYAFELSEKGKAYLLLINAQEKNIQQTSDIPQNLAQKENELENKLILLEKSIQNQEQKGENANQELLQQWKIDSFNTYTQFETLKKQLETDYPNYYQQKYNTEIVFITNLQSSLQENQTVLSYFIGEEKIYLFAITPDEYEVFTLEKPDNWTNLVQNYLQSIKLHQKTEFHRYSFELYQTLLQEAMHHIIDPFEEEVKQVFIIPHAELHYLPFETLLIAEADTSISYNELDYLLNHCQISYHYSATLLHLDLQKQASSAEQAPTEMTFTGFAPVYESSSEGQKQALQSLQSDYATAVNRSEAVRGDGTWMPLPYSKIEVENIAQLFEQQGLKNQFFLNERANKRNLEKQIGKSRFVLIAAHGIVNNEYPELSGLVLAENTMDDRWRTTNGVENSPSFEKHGDIWNGEEERNVEEMAVEDCILNMKEVAMIPMDADLVVLSSCESGIGELHKGEGMMAVNRGFLASGAKNVVSTLFKVNDRASSELTQLLFANILKGENYSIALQKAKLELLKKRKDVSPKMWSGFVLFGTGL